MTSSPPLRRQGNPARAAAVAGAVAAFVLLERSLDGWWSASTVYVGFADGTLATLSSVPWLVLSSSFGQAVPVFLGREDQEGRRQRGHHASLSK